MVFLIQIISFAYNVVWDEQERGQGERELRIIYPIATR